MQDAESKDEERVFAAALAWPETTSPLALLDNWGPGAEVDLGRVAVGEVHHFRINLLNPTDKDVVFRKILAGCACADVTTGAKVFPARAVTPVAIRYVAPKTTTTELAEVKVLFFDENDGPGATPVASIVLRIGLAGNLALHPATSRFEMGEEGLSLFEIPVYFSSPVEGSSLRAFKSSEFDDLKLDLVEKEGRPFLILSVAAGSLPSAGLRGRIGVEDVRLEKRASLEITVHPRQQVSIAPDILRFRQVADQPDHYRATALVRVLPKSGVGIQEIESLSCFQENTRIPVKLASLANGIHRAEFLLERDELSALLDPGEAATADRVGSNRRPVTWRILLAGEKESIVLSTGLLGDLK